MTPSHWFTQYLWKLSSMAQWLGKIRSKGSLQPIENHGHSTGLTLTLGMKKLCFNLLIEQFRQNMINNETYTQNCVWL